MKILIYGSYGWIGSQFMDIITKYEDFVIHRGTSRLDNIDDVKKLIASNACKGDKGK